MKQNYRPIVAICVISAVFAGALCMSPGISNFMDYYGVPESTVTLILTIPPLVSIPFTILTGKLVDYISRKFLTLLSIAVVTICGMLPMFFGGFPFLIGTRVVMGAALGIIYSIAPTLPAICYPEGKMRNLGMGMQSAFSCGSGIIFNIISGYLVSIRTDRIFLIYILCAIFFVLAAIFLPNLKKNASVITDKPDVPDDTGKKGGTFDKKCLPFVISTYVFILCTFAVMMNVSLFMKDSGIGNSIQAGYVSASFSVMAFLSGCFYNTVVRIFKTRTRFFGCVFSVIGLLLCSFTKTLALACIGNALAGLAVTMMHATTISEMTKAVRPAAFNMSISILLSINYLAHSTIAYIITPLGRLINDAVQSRFIICASIMVLVTIYMFFDENYRRKQARKAVKE